MSYCGVLLLFLLIARMKEVGITGGPDDVILRFLVDLLDLVSMVDQFDNGNPF